MGKIRVVVLFGGQSSEHVVSCMSAANVIDRIDQEKYELLLIGITEEGRWIRTECVEDIRSGSHRKPEDSGAKRRFLPFLCIAKRVTGNGVYSNLSIYR